MGTSGLILLDGSSKHLQEGEGLQQEGGQQGVQGGREEDEVVTDQTITVLLYSVGLPSQLV